jgi:hypothetical protein
VSSLAAFFTACAVITVVTPVLLWQIHRAWRAEQAKNTDPYETGMDDPRLPASLDEHLNGYVAADPDLWEVFGVGGPWDVLGPGDTTTHHEGEL